MTAVLKTPEPKSETFMLHHDMTALILQAVLAALPGADKDRTCTALCHVLVRFREPGKILVVATDGKLLLEETISLEGADESTRNQYADIPDVLVQPETALLRKVFALTKSSRKVPATRVYMVVTMATVEDKFVGHVEKRRRVSEIKFVANDQEALQLSCPDALFPQYSAALSSQRLNTAFKDTQKFAVSLPALGVIAEYWKDLGANRIATFDPKSGFVIAPLFDHRKRVALLMPCTLPT